MVLGDPDESCHEQPTGLGGDSWVRQIALVPNDGVPRLNGWYRIYTWDRNRTGIEGLDQFEILINDALVFDDRNTSDAFGCGGPALDLGWRPFSIPLSSYRGQFIDIMFVNVVAPDNVFNSWTYIDDISISP